MKDKINRNKPGWTIKLKPWHILVFAIFMVLLIGNSMAVAVGYNKVVYPGQWVNLTGPSAPSGVTYSYLWSVQQGSSGTEVIVKDASGNNVGKTSQNLSFVAPWYDSNTVLSITLLVSAQKTGGNSLAGCAQSTSATILVQAPTDSDLTGDTGDHCTDTPSTYTYNDAGPGLTYQWFLGPTGITPATTAISTYTAGITPSSVTSTTNSITIAWALLKPCLRLRQVMFRLTLARSQ